MKKIAMIPLALGSTRIPDKNLLYIDGNLPVSYVVKACREAGCFDEIVINSEHDIFARVAEQLGVRFWKRPPQSGGSACTMENASSRCHGDRCQVHDHFIYAFLKNNPCEHVFMVHATSPLMRPNTIQHFVDEHVKNQADVTFSTTHRYMEAFFKGQPLNFDAHRKQPTQTLEPVAFVSWALTAWKTESYMKNYSDGPTFAGRRHLVEIPEAEAFDADTFEEFDVIEACLRHRKSDKKRFYYDERVVGIENELQELIGRDGVPGFASAGMNQLHDSLSKAKAMMGDPPWCYLIAYSDTDQCAYICQPPGDGCRTHCHITKDEWWYIIEGDFEWYLPEKEKTIKATAGDTVFLEKGTIHKITCVGDKPGIRLAHGARDMEHIYYE